jgi:N-acyl-D-aspartate/D-glutamate deacylase
LLARTLTLVALPWAVAIAAGACAPRSFDLVIVNGRVVDPESGLDAVRALGINAGRIVEISSASLTGRAVIDASGLVVAPGFVDLHSHTQSHDVYKLRAADGVTSAFELEIGTADVDAWYREREAGQLINYGVSAGHIQVRMAVFNDPGTRLPTGPAAHQTASPAEVAEIVRRLELGLDQGAVSMGAGFVYTPAASREELVAVFGIAGRRQVPVHLHSRRGVAGVEEALALAAETRAPLHIVHLNSTSVSATPEVLAMIAAARSKGMAVTTEAYPYTAGMTEIQSANLDEYAKAPPERVALLEWPRTGERLTRESFQRYRKLGGPVVTHTNTEDMVRVAIASPLTMIASDAYWEDGIGHPRTTGTYSKILGRYVREATVISLMDAIRKMTLMPARHLEDRVPAMKTKGRIRVGADADIVVFDAATILDRSTYREPALPATGIRHVLVNGIPVVANGQVVDGARPGRAVRAPVVQR